VQLEAAAVASLSDAQLAEQFQALGAPERDTMPRALALAQEAASRTLGMRPYPVQLMGAAALFDGVIAEMKTGEGKTLVIALAAAMAALSKKGVHVAVPNPYLATRDANSMRPFFEFLRLKVGVSVAGLSLEEKQAAYAADITYAVHSELGFDYLRDHLVASVDHRVQRGHHFAIVDEADSILIDEARTPLVISQPAADDSRFALLADYAVRPLRVNEDVLVDEAQKNAVLTEQGMDRIGALFVAHGVVPSARALYEPAHLHLMRYVRAALRARFAFHRDRDYLVRNEAIHIIDPTTGRVLNGRQWQHGLHQAIEIKERVPIQPEVETAAEITYQTYFGLYSQLAGLTGTATPAAEEFEAIYRKPVLRIPTHRPVIRLDLEDLLFVDRATKFRAIVDDVVEQREAGRPVLIGAGSVEESEAISQWLSWAGVPHRVLNARQNAEEAQIIADAGLPGAVTVATNMAGRGTDILLGGHDLQDPEHAARRARVVAAGGLHVIGTRRLESRRVDDQLRGRAGRQGDPGSSRFYLSLEDDLLRVYGARNIEALAALLGKKEGQGVPSRMIAKIVRRAQERIESANFGARHQLSLTDEAISQQRAAVYALRNEVLENKLGLAYLESVLADSIGRVVQAYIDPSVPSDQWELLTLKTSLREAYQVDLPLMRWASVEELSAEEIRQRVLGAVLEAYRSGRTNASDNFLTPREQLALLTALDRTWREHLTELDAIREGIHLRAYAQQNPVHVFAKEARDAFSAFKQAYEDTAASYLWQLRYSEGGLEAPPVPVALRAPAPAPAQSSPREHLVSTRKSQLVCISRLAPCPCGSSRRFKHCHGALEHMHATDDACSVSSYRIRIQLHSATATAAWMDLPRNLPQMKAPVIRTGALIGKVSAFMASVKSCGARPDERTPAKPAFASVHGSTCPEKVRKHLLIGHSPRVNSPRPAGTR